MFTSLKPESRLTDRRSPRYPLPAVSAAAILLARREPVPRLRVVVCLDPATYRLASVLLCPLAYSRIPIGPPSTCLQSRLVSLVSSPNHSSSSLSPSGTPGPWKVAHLVGLVVSLDLGDHDLSIGIGRDVNGLSYQLFLSCSYLHSTDLLVGKTRVLLGVEVLQVSLDGQCSSSLHSTQQPSSPSHPLANASTSDPQQSSHTTFVPSSST